MSDSIQYDLQDTVAVITMDDGKANAVSPTLVEALNAALDRAEGEAGAIALFGRAGRFSAGFDLSVMGQGGSAMGSLVRSGALLARRMSVSPVPIVIGCTGHALAMGGLMLLSADHRIGAAGDFKIGLNEVAIGMTLPGFGVELVRARVVPTHATRAAANAEIFAPETAVTAGFLDQVVAADGLHAAVLAEAARLAGLNASAHQATKNSLRKGFLDAFDAALDAEFPASD